MRVTTPSGIECGVSVIGVYDTGPHSKRIDVMVTLEPGYDPTSGDDAAVFDWLCTGPDGAPLLDPLLRSPGQVTQVRAERWSDPGSGRPRVTYDIFFTY